MTTTFKVFKPNGECRRVTFPSIPELAAINEFVDSMVEATADRRHLTYVDSEGDRVVIKTSRDVKEAARDAQQARAKTIKIHVRTLRQGGKCGGPRHQGGPCGRGRSLRGLFAHPAEVAGEFRDIAHALDAIFPGVFGSSVSPDSSVDESAESAEAAAPPSSEADAPAEKAAPVEAEKAAPVEAEKAAPTAASPSEADESGSQSSSRACEASSEEAKEESPAAPSPPATSEEDDLGAKAALLRDMGFELPLDVARNMITEMGGRMDLIVRALVANSK